MVFLRNATRNAADPGRFFSIDTTGGLLKARIKGCDLVFAPHYLRYKERYGIYFYYKTEEEVKNGQGCVIPGVEKVVDTVMPGYGQYEDDDLHAMREKDTASVTNEGTYRYAKAGGSFVYRMAVKKECRNFLTFTLKAADNLKSLKVTAGDTVLFDDILRYEGSEDSYVLRLEIPAQVAEKAVRVNANERSYDVVDIGFAGRDGAESARVCEFIYILASQE